MAKQMLTYRCLIISPGDIQEERDAVATTLGRWNASIGQALDVRVEAIRWETHAHPDSGKSPQDIINRQLVDGSDFGVAIFGSRLGTPTESYDSGSVEEVERLLADGVSVMAYFSAGMHPNTVDLEQLRDLRTFQQSLRSRSLFFEFENTPALQEHVTHHVTALVSGLAKQHRYADPSTFVEARTSDPVSPKLGQIWLRTDL